jgi:hypothetical protein
LFETGVNEKNPPILLKAAGFFKINSCWLYSFRKLLHSGVKKEFSKAAGTHFKRFQKAAGVDSIFSFSS